MEGGRKRRLEHVARVLAGGGVAGVPGKTAPNSIEAVLDFVADPAWAGKPFWMLNLLRFRESGGAEAYAKYGIAMTAGDEGGTLASVGARVIVTGPARTVVGRRPYHMMAIVEYPSPEAFLLMTSHPNYAAHNKIRLSGLAEQYLIPISAAKQPEIDAPLLKPRLPPIRFDPEMAATTSSGLVGSAGLGARVGVTSGTQDQARDLINDSLISDESRVWHLNLLKFRGGRAGRKVYRRYADFATATGLPSVGGRVVYSGRCLGRSLIGDIDFDTVAIAEYPNKHAYLQMGIQPDYIAASEHRHRALQETYIVSCAPSPAGSAF